MGTTAKKWALSVLAGCLMSTPALAWENNWWPVFVRQEDSPSGRPDQTTSLGPIFSIKETDIQRIVSFRPFWTSFYDSRLDEKTGHILYPLINLKDTPTRDSDNAFLLVKYFKDDPRQRTYFHIFPFIFYNDLKTEPEESYFAFWPFGGVTKDRFWRDRISFVLWPLYVRTVKGDETRYHFPYPFLRRLTGPHSRGGGFWPFYGHTERDNDYEHTWAAWPFYYNYHDDLDKPVSYHRFGVLPFYSRETGDGLMSETFVWPFFGYTRETGPRIEYSENRYFWPFFVQGRGEERYKNRWMPFYTHEWRSSGFSGMKDEKHWYLWPVLKTRTLTEPGLVRERTSVLYFLFREERQHFADTVARKSTLWPLYGYWNNGNGQQQFQMLDPFTAFFPRNEKIRENWAPLFALYQWDQRQGERRHSLLWNLVVWEKGEDGMKSFYAGPLFEWVNDDHWSVLKGLIGTKQDGEERRMRFFWKR